MAERAGRQFGVISRRQLLERGFSARRTENWLETGRLHRLYRGVYALGRADLSVEGELAAALLYAGTGSALGGVTALWWTGLLGRPDRRIWVDAPGRVRTHPSFHLRHPIRLERRFHRGLPVVSLPDALLPAASVLGHDTLRLVLARAEFEGLLSLSSLQASLGPGRRGSAALRAAMDAHLPQLARCESELERRFVLLCERWGLPLPDPNERFGRYRPDMLWRATMLIVELDGKRGHRTAAQRASDAHRQAYLESLGYTVLRFDWDDVTSCHAQVAAELRRRLP